MNTQSLTLFVGNTDDSLSNYAKNYSKSAVLIEPKDIKNLTNISIGYISIGDHSIEDFLTALEYASEIYYVPTNTWDTEQTKKQTEFQLRMVARRIPVHNLDLIKEDHMLTLTDVRKTENSQLWAVGCSITYGVGVDYTETYGYLLSQSLGMPLGLLAEPGSSITWAADQILRSDIRKDDIVVWGLTGISRFPHYQDGKIMHILAGHYEGTPQFNKLINQRILLSDHMLYLAYTAISKVVIHSRLIGYKLVLTQFPLNVGDYDLYMLHFLSQFDFFVPTYINAGDKMLDIGSDDKHPGPLQHKHYATLINNYFKNENLS